MGARQSQSHGHGAMHDVNAFEIGDKIFLKHPFDAELFSAVRQYYDPVRHRFEISHEEFETIQATFESHSYRAVLVDDIREYCVVTRPGLTGSVRRRLKELFASHLYDPFPAENRHEFRAWKQYCEGATDVVLQGKQRDRVVQVMKDKEAVERAVNADAKLVSETDIDPFQVLE